MSDKVRLGIIGSSGGSALSSARDCLHESGFLIDWVIVTDRECGLEKWAQIHGHQVRRINYNSSREFSIEANAFFQDLGCNDVMLYYSRRISEPLIGEIRVSNIHPALLPAFRGLHGVRDAMSAGVKLMGATLHLVDEGLDTGPIVAQVVAPLPSEITLDQAERISYIQKVWLTMVWFDQLIIGNIATRSPWVCAEIAAANPGLSDNKAIKSFLGFLDRLNSE